MIEITSQDITINAKSRFYVKALKKTSKRICGVYALSFHGTLQYIGVSSDVMRRIVDHMRVKRIPFTAFTVFPIEELESAERAEQNAITSLVPPYNKYIPKSIDTSIKSE